MAERDFVGSKEQELLNKIRDDIWNLKLHVDTLGEWQGLKGLVYDLREKHSECENYIRRQFKMNNLPKKINKNANLPLS
jgi:hypothetical protein